MQKGSVPREIFVERPTEHLYRLPRRLYFVAIRGIPKKLKAMPTSDDEFPPIYALTRMILEASNVVPHTGVYGTLGYCLL